MLLELTNRVELQARLGPLAGPSLRQRNRVLMKRIATRFLEAVSWVLGHRERHPIPPHEDGGKGVGDVPDDPAPS